MEGALRRAAPLLVLALLPGCAGHRAGWASRGRYEVLYETPSVQIRRGAQKIDPQTGELVLAWAGARTPEGQPELVACDLTVFDDHDADGAPGADEILAFRENREPTAKIVFGDVRVRPKSSATLKARIVASTAKERCVVSWRVAPDG